MMLLIYTPKRTSRNRYVFKTVIKNYLLLESYQLTDEKEVFLKHEGPKFSYSTNALADELHFIPHGLLEQSGIKEQSLALAEHQGIPVLFKNTQQSALPYDPFAAIFYFLTRYEEYLPHLRDNYDRFTAKESLAYKEGFLQTAIVERWVQQIKEVLSKQFRELVFPARSFKYIPTIDIDNAYAYKHKGIVRSVGSLARTLTQLDLNKFGRQINVLFGRSKDPFDTYNYQLNIQKRYGLKPLYFVLIGDYGLNDKNISYENRNFKTLIKSISDYATLGIHPSFGSNKQPKKLTVEIDRLQQIIKREIKKSRQHFLKLSLPETYRNLIEADIEEDYTMGFATEIGFRAGTCTPYPFYDIDGEVACKLMVYPFQLMEATLKYYQKLSVEESITKVKKIIDEIKSVNGTFISLWHNESLSDEMEWVGWRKVYEEMVAYATK